MKRKYKIRIKRRYDGSSLGIKFGGEVTMRKVKERKLVSACSLGPRIRVCSGIVLELPRCIISASISFSNPFPGGPG